MNDLTSYLFKTNAFRVCEDNKPFWYTSGKIGPYFINGQFLYGSEDDANNLLKFIDNELENTSKDKIPQDIFSKVLYQYEHNDIYSTIINSLISYIKENIPVDEIDYVSGGERRDWYFSNIVAYLLEKPHITIYKDLSTVVSSYDFSKNEVTTQLEKRNVLHVADLLNQASSYLRAWIPTIENIGGKIVWSICVIDRNEGGTQKLIDAGLKPYALINIDVHLFEKALNLGIINYTQLNMLKDFSNDQFNTMRKFLLDHPEFIENSLKLDDRTVKRVRTCLDNDLYNLKEESK